jgi:DNA replicative helicase MCM subunit Mcm2 (Cdc46/Mcm family)
MKNVLVTAVLFILIFSCKKSSDCYTCTSTFNVTHRDTVESVSWSVSDTKELCDMTESAIRKYEADNNDTLVEVNGTVTTTTIVITKCDK